MRRATTGATEPSILKAGKAFHTRVQADYLKLSEGHPTDEQPLPFLWVGGRRRPGARGRLDLLVDFPDDDDVLVSVIEIKSTDWDKVQPANRKRLMHRHARQIWDYIDELIETRDVEVSPGIIYPSAPATPGLREEIEYELNGVHPDGTSYGLQVVWYDEVTAPAEQA